MAHSPRIRMAALPLLFVLGACGTDVGSPSSAPAATPRAAELIEPGATAETFQELAAGTYRVDDPFQVPLSFEVPEGFSAWAYTSAGTQLNLASEMGEVSFEIVDNVVADPCSEEPLNPPLGSSVDDLVAALAALEGFEATAPEAITIDGVSGVRFTLTAPAAPEAVCEDLFTWRTSTRQNGVGAGEVAVVNVLDVNGVRLLIAIAGGDSTGADAETLQAIVDSVQFD